MNKRIFIIALVAAFWTISNSCHSEEPRLKKVVDSQGNQYQVDEKGDIYSDGIPHPNRKPASVENLGYYLNQAGMLEANGYADEAGKIYQEILSLPEVNESVKAAKEAAKLRLKSRDSEQVDWDKIDARLFLTIKQEGGKSDAEIYQAMGIAHQKQENWDRAEKYFKKAVNLDPKLQWSWYNLALLNTDTEEGYNYNKKATEASPKFSIPYYWMAYYRCRNREDKKAIPLFEKYLELAVGDKQEEGRIKVAKEVLADLKAGKEGQSLSMMRRLPEEEDK